ncbi:hypothetical protein P7K49_003462 [Saguinus oedipus]|uniref:Kinesin motor domain-containing protein n=1 Tax=Saguinus oedipus TaxID=9490 RepID=A0ABQ9W4M4_SAGOE|nr:hypothetical protein P7K49_003462 [Saguinus oedipus]
MKEGVHINRSLLALGNCINTFSEKGSSRAQYVNFQDSKLTRLLKVKRNLLNVSYRIAQYTEVISDLCRKIKHLKSKIEKQEKEKKSEACIQDARVPMLSHDAEEDSHVQMNKIWAQLLRAFKEQMETRRSLVELENTNIELHMDVSCHLLTIADWEREKTQPHTHRGGGKLEKDEEPAQADADGDEGKASELHEVVLAREEVNLLLAEQRKTAALKVWERASPASRRSLWSNPREPGLDSLQRDFHLTWSSLVLALGTSSEDQGDDQKEVHT